MGDWGETGSNSFWWLEIPTGTAASSLRLPTLCTTNSFENIYPAENGHHSYLTSLGTPSLSAGTLQDGGNDFMVPISSDVQCRLPRVVLHREISAVLE